jgi:hypothetical protein
MIKKLKKVVDFAEIFTRMIILKRHLQNYFGYPKYFANNNVGTYPQVYERVGSKGSYGVLCSTESGSSNTRTSSNFLKICLFCL